MNIIYKSLILFFICNIFSLPLHCQTITFEQVYKDTVWQNQFASVCNDVISTKDGNYVILTTTNNPTSTGITCLIKLNPLGDTLWTKAFGFDTEELAKSIEETSDAGFIIAGSTRVMGGLNNFSAKTDSAGNIIWMKIYSGIGSYFNKIKSTFDGGYVVCTGGSGRYPSLLKIDSLGNPQWHKFYSLDSAINPNTTGYSFDKTTDGGFILTGYFYSTLSLPAYSLFLIKVDSLGNVTWSKCYRGNVGTAGYSVLQSKDKGYVIYGINEFASTTQHQNLFIKTDSLGIIQWSRINSNFSYSYYSNFGNNIIQTADSNFVFLVSTERMLNGDSQFLLMQMDVMGNALWCKMYGGIGFERIGGFAMSNDGGFLLGGSSRSFGYNSLYLIKTDSSGNGVCSDSSVAANTSNIALNTFIQNVQTGNLVTTALDTFSVKSVRVEKTSLCSPVGVEENIFEKNSYLLIFPNPVSKLLTIFLSKSEDIEVFDCLGKSIFRKKMLLSAIAKFDIDVSSLIPGIYFIKVGNKIGKFCKQ